MWIVDWLVNRFSALSNLLDNLYNSIVNIVGNVVSWIINNGTQVEGRANGFSINRDTILDQILRGFTNALHNLGIIDTNQKVGSEASSRTLNDNDIRNTVVQRAIEAKNNLEMKEAAIKQEMQVKHNLLKQAQESGDTQNKTFIDQVNDALNAFRGNFDAWFGAVGEILTAFAQNPIGFVASILFEIVLEIVLYQLADGIARPGLDIGSRPSFGSGNSPSSGGSIDLPPQSLFVRIPITPAFLTGRTFDLNSHPGFDFGGDKESVIWSALNGKVTRVVNRGEQLGYEITLLGEKQEVKYVGVRQTSVVFGQPVKDNVQIGTGCVEHEGFKAHIHFEVKINNRYYDPLLVSTRR